MKISRDWAHRKLSPETSARVDTRRRARDATREEGDAIIKIIARAPRVVRRRARASRRARVALITV